MKVRNIIRLEKEFNLIGRYFQIQLMPMYTIAYAGKKVYA